MGKIRNECEAATESLLQSSWRPGQSLSFSPLDDRGNDCGGDDQGDSEDKRPDKKETFLVTCLLKISMSF